ncbi:MAG: sigma-54-dependent Fis family transcriptional regulator [bacterium]
MEYKVDPYRINNKPIPDEDIIFRLNRATELINASWPFIQELGNLVAGSGFKIDLIDNEGFSLKVIGDKETIRKGSISGISVGTSRLEESEGTNAAGLALAINQPVQVNGPEHFNQTLWEWTCSACPIHDPDGRILGVVNMAGHINLSHKHTLGMVISIANAIEKLLNLRRLNQKNENLFTNYLETMIDAISDGFYFFNSRKQLIGANHKARQILNLSDLAQNTDYSYLENMLLSQQTIAKYLNSHEECNEQEITLLKKNYYLTIKHFPQEGSVVVVKEMKKQNITQQAYFTLDDIVGNDPRIKDAIALVQKIAPTNAPVLIWGESGTGKEMFAQAIHNASNRAHQPFVPINCSAIPAELIESELFGYEAGAFTGAAIKGKPGLMEIASGGTLFFDEIESMPLNMQTKILRALSERRIIRVGGTERIPIDIRIISATKKDLLQATEEGNFREDLYYRINVVTIELPPLRERLDLKLLIKAFIKKFSIQYGLKDLTVDEDFIAALCCYSWRGNVRELENVINRAFLLHDNNRIGLQQLTPEISKNYLNQKINSRQSLQNRGNLLHDMEKELIIQVLQNYQGNLKKSALRLGISRSTLYEKIQRYQIAIEQFR